jgi:hypothetical protein
MTLPCKPHATSVAYRSRLRSQWLPARLFGLALPALLSGLFSFNIRLAIDGLSLFSDIIVARTWQVTNQTRRVGKVEVYFGGKIQERAFVIVAEGIGILETARWRGTQAMQGLLGTHIGLDLGGTALSLGVGIVGGKGSKQEILLIWRKVQTLLVSLIVITHGGV